MLSVIPPSTTLNRTTVDLLNEFVLKGGSLVVCAPYPTLINGEAYNELEWLIQKAYRPGWNSEEVVEAILKTVPPTLRLKDEQGVVLADDNLNVQSLELDGTLLFYFVNSGQERYGQVEVELLRKGKVEMIDLETGETRPIGQAESADGVRVQLSMHPGQSYMLKMEAQNETLPLLSDKEAASEVSRIELNPTWNIASTTLNSLTLDNCRLCVEDGEWSQKQPVILIQEQLLAYGRPIEIQLEFEFQVEFDVSLARELYLVLEKPEQFEIEINGCKVESLSCGTWRDVSFQKIEMDGKVQSGVNRIRLKTNFFNSPETYKAIEIAREFESEVNKLTLDTEIESIYILGEFGVAAKSPFTNGERKAVYTHEPFVLTELTAVVNTGDLVRQGFPFFAGTIRLQQQLHLDTPERSEAKWHFSAPPDAIVTKLFVNGYEARTFLWEPYEADITQWLHTGENLIEIELTNSCRNLLGPHHHIQGEIYKVGPSSFTDTPGWTDKDVEKGTHMYTDRYCFVQFGLPALSYIRITTEEV